MVAKGDSIAAKKRVEERSAQDIVAAIKKRRAPQVQTDGISSKTLPVSLPRGALVRRFEVLVTADHADRAPLANVAQVRAQPTANDGVMTLVIDFGTPRTVAAIGSDDEQTQIAQVWPWSGSAFAHQSIYSPTQSTPDDEVLWVTPDPPSRSDYAVLPEVRTERLKVLLFTPETDVGVLSLSVWVQLPDAPADLELRIDQGTPVFRSPGPVQAERDGWDADASRTVDITAALDALTHDPTAAEANVTFQLTLVSRVPGLLDLTPKTSSNQVSYLQRVDLGSEGKLSLTFDAEGQQTVPLALRASTAAVEGVALVVSGTLPPERAVPPLGPPIATTLGGATQSGGIAELVLDPDHSACVLPQQGADLGELVAVRLSLRADPGGAEVRVLLLGRADTVGGPEPGQPTGASSKSVTLDGPEAGSGDEDPDPWTTFSFARPVPFKSGDPLPWVQVVVVRGVIRWTLGQFGNDPPNSLRRGPTAGPWSKLPGLLGDEAGIGGRVRLVGHARKDKPIAPLAFGLAGPAQAVSGVGATPTAKGVPVSLQEPSGQAIVPRVASGSKTVDLVVVSSVAGTVTVRDIDVTGRK